MQWHKINISIPNGRKRGIQRNWTKARLKPRKANIKLCSSVSSTWGKLWWGVIPKGFRQGHPHNFVGCSPHGLSLKMASLPSSDVPCFWLLQPPGLSPELLASLSQLPTLPFQGHTAWPARPSSEIWADSPLLYNYFILHVWKTTIIWMMPRSATNWSSNWALFHLAEASEYLDD